MSSAWSSVDSVMSSAALRARRLSSWTVKMTGVSGAASLNWRASLSAASSSGRTLIRVLICSWNTLWQSAAWRASSWLMRLLAGRRRPGVPDADRLAAALGGQRGGGRSLFPRATGSAVGGDEDLEVLAQRGDEDEARRVILRRGFPPGTAGAPGGDFALGTSLRSTASAA